MRRIACGLTACVVGLALTGPARGLDGPPAEDPEKVKKVDAILAEWERKSAAITQVDATFTRVDLKSGAFKSKTEYEGHALLKASNLARLDVKKVAPEDNAKKTFHMRVVCTGAEVVQYDGETRMMYVFPLPKERESEKNEAARAWIFTLLFRWTFYVEHGGPIGFLRPQKAGALKERYQVEWIAESGRVFRLRFVPKGAVDRDLSSEILIDLNKQTFLPDALQNRTPNGKETQTYIFTTVKPNAPIDPANFEVREIEGWKVIRHPNAVALPELEEEPGPDAKGPESPGAGRGSG